MEARRYIQLAPGQELVLIRGTRGELPILAWESDYSILFAGTYLRRSVKGVYLINLHRPEQEELDLVWRAHLSVMSARRTHPTLMGTMRA